jgi:hypothetical protein
MDSNITKHKHIVGSDCKITIYRRDVKKEEKELFFFRNKCWQNGKRRKSFKKKKDTQKNVFYKLIINDLWLIVSWDCRLQT